MPMKNKKNNISDGNISQFCKINLQLEALLYSIFAFIIYLPIAATKIVWKGLIYASIYVPKFIELIIVSIILPIFTSIWYLLKYIGKIIMSIARVVVSGILFIWRKLKYLYSIINWGIVRSIIRIISLLSSLISIYIISNGIYTYPLKQIFTGYFYDADSNIYMIHIAVIILMTSIVSYYNAWALSDNNEIRFVRKNMWSANKHTNKSETSLSIVTLEEK
jgi:hypothetical protein